MEARKVPEGVNLFMAHWMDGKLGAYAQQMGNGKFGKAPLRVEQIIARARCARCAVGQWARSCPLATCLHRLLSQLQALHLHQTRCLEIMCRSLAEKNKYPMPTSFNSSSSTTPWRAMQLVRGKECCTPSLAENSASVEADEEVQAPWDVDNELPHALTTTQSCWQSTLPDSEDAAELAWRAFVEVEGLPQTAQELVKPAWGPYVAQ
eukprot:2101903-Amphidinium_carterae.2